MKLKIETTVTFVVTSSVRDEAVTPADISRIVAETKKRLTYNYVQDHVESAVGRATHGRTTSRRPLVAVRTKQ